MESSGKSSANANLLAETLTTMQAQLQTQTEISQQVMEDNKIQSALLKQQMEMSQALLEENKRLRAAQGDQPRFVAGVKNR